MSLFGYDQGVFSKQKTLAAYQRIPLTVVGGVVISQDYLKTHNLEGDDKTNLSAIVTSIYAIGCTVGAIVAFSIGEGMGRKKTIMTGTVIMTIGAILQASSFSVAQMMIARIISGYVHA